MGKLISISLAVVLQLGGLVGAHFYYDGNPRDAIVVVDSSYGLKAYQAQIDQWIGSFLSSKRYTEVHFATDKSYLGVGLSNKDKLYRVSFGKMDSGALNQQYTTKKYDERILLTFTGQDIDGWKVVNFSN